MNRSVEKKKKKKRILLLLTSLLITAVFAGSVYLSINAMGEALPGTSVDHVNDERSQLLVSGKNYSLEKEQEELYSRELEKEAQKRETEQVKEPEETVESIVTETVPPEKTEVTPEPEKEQNTAAVQTPEPTLSPTVPPTPTPTPEPTVPPTPTPEPEDTAAPTPVPTDIQTPTVEPTQTSAPDVTGDPEGGEEKPGDDGTPVPSDGPDGGHGDEGEGEGEEGENPTPSPTETPEVVNTDPTIECSLVSGTEYLPSFSFTLRGQDYRQNIIESNYYTVWFDGVQIYSSGTDGSGYATYHPEGQADTYDGDHEITVTVTDAEGHASSITYAVSLQSETIVVAEEYVSLTVDAGSIYTSGSFMLVSDMVQIYPGETAASLVDRVLRAWGFDPQAVNDWRGYYLARIARPGMIDLSQVREEYRESIYTMDSLGERDVTNFSGWLYLVNGAYMDAGMSSVSLTDGDEIYVWFSLNPQEDPLAYW